MKALVRLWLLRWSRTPIAMALLSLPPFFMLVVWGSLRYKRGLAPDAELLTSGMVLLLSSLAYVLGFWPIREERQAERTVLLSAAPSGWTLPLAVLAAGQIALFMSALMAVAVTALEALEGRPVPYAALVSATAQCQAGMLISACLGLHAGLVRLTWEMGPAGLAVSLGIVVALMRFESTPMMLLIAWLGAIVCLGLWPVISAKAVA